MRSYVVAKIDDTTRGIFCEFIPRDEYGEGEAMTLLLRISDFYDAHISVGKIISDDEFEALYEASAIARATAKAEAFLSGGDHSKKQLVQKLVRADIDRSYAEKAALIMEERGFIDEDGQAERLARAYNRRKGWGQRRILTELLQRGYEREAALAAAGFISPEEYMETLKAVIERKFPDPPEDKKERDRRIASLLRLGYSLSEITEAFRESYR
ncbi:MAG: RecX family transcriptional regulator [Clostridia bacterium]|nr:RecX family transcriptional regulator [Clostridia bacterium]